MAVQALDEMLAEDANLDALRDALTAHLHKDPMRFFKEIIMPLLPKHAVLDMGPREPVRWGSLVDACRQAERRKEESSSTPAAAVLKAV